LRLDENLLVAIHPFAASNDEDFTTEILVFLLNRLQSLRTDLFSEIVSCLTCDLLIPGDQPADKLKVTSQSHTEYGRPDIQMVSNSVLIYIEVKTGARLGPSQLERYRRALDDSDKNTKLLFLLSRKPYEISEPLDGAVRWMTVGKVLNSQIEMCDPGSEERFLLKQITGFLEYRRLHVHPPASEVSTLLEAYIEREGKNSIFNKSRIRSFESLDGIEELIPLQQLLSTLEETIKNVQPAAKVSLDSAKTSWQKTPWVGLNVDGLYFLFVYLDNPDVVHFETWKVPIDPRKFGGQSGSIFVSYGDPKWTDYLDLQDLDFYSKAADQKFNTLEDFYSRCLAVKDSLIG